MTSDVIPESDSVPAAGTYRFHMDLLTLLRRHGDGVWAVALATLMTAELVAWTEADLALPVLYGLLATLPLAWRRRSPLAAFVLVMTGIELLSFLEPGFDNDSSAFVIAFVHALYSLGRHARGIEAWVGAAALLAVMVLFAEGEEGIGQADLGDMAFLIGFVGAPWAAGLTLRFRGDLARSHARLQAEQAEREQRAIAAERARIARELHDVVSHAISVTVLQARGARRVLDADPEAARDALDAIERTNTAALGDMRRLLAVLRDTEEDAAEQAPQPTLARLDGLVAQVRASGVPVEVEVVGKRRELPPGVDLSAYRIVQEALTNVLKHSDQASARVTLDYGDAALAVIVEDDGTPRANGTSAPGHGLIGIRERVSVVGGEVEAGPRAGGGFEVRARLPYSLEVS
jgi:signal transduction histidine kinase